MTISLSRQARGALLAVFLLAALPALAGKTDADLDRAARLHLSGETAKAVALWRALAEKGDVDAAYNLAVIHQYGDGVAVNAAEALRWYRFAAERDDRLSQYQLGMMYLRGEGVAVDEKEAHRWFVMHRAHHFHHQHTPQMVAWRRQAAALLREQELRETAAATLRDSARVVAELKGRCSTACGAKTPGIVALGRPQAQDASN